ncbi:hypothetical protein BC941DRAFT_465691 [Chlamydoabsidia padenii]|nr:hypothetical protein BC941DRAFT_465691 [Chlamydoabsidia padenii]
MHHTPKAAWLKKMTVTMGKPRWQVRYFVLLETEIRYYKDEHAATPNYIWSLRNVDQVKQITMAGQMYCLSLEPTLTVDDKMKKKDLVLNFQSAFEMHEWQEQIAGRLVRLTTSKPTITSTSSISLNRRRGVILSSIDISKEYPNGLISPNLTLPPTPTESIYSSTSSVSTLHQCYSPPQSINTDSLTFVDYDRNDSDDPSASPTFLQYKNQFHL